MAARSLCDKVVVVTGGARGIGAATARQLAQLGANLAICDRDQEALRRCSSELRAAAPNHLAIAVDVSNRDSLRALYHSAMDAFGTIDVLVNCAGIIRPGQLDHQSPTAIEEQFEVNVLGTIYTTQLLLPLFRSQQKGHFIHLASLGGIVPLPFEAPYSATKFAVRGFCLAMALELRGTPIAVSVICPDSTQTSQLLEEAIHRGSSLSFAGRPLTTGDVARAIVQTIRKPRMEVAVPSIRGPLAKLAGASPRLLRLLYPWLDRLGIRGRYRFLAKLGTMSSEGARLQ
jgi:short-subunit dehydrogenase